MHFKVSYKEPFLVLVGGHYYMRVNAVSTVGKVISLHSIEL